MMIMMVLVMMMNVQLRDPNFEAEIWPRKRRTAKAHVRSRELWLSACFRPGIQPPKQSHFHIRFFGSFSTPFRRSIQTATPPCHLVEWATVLAQMHRR